MPALESSRSTTHRRSRYGTENRGPLSHDDLAALIEAVSAAIDAKILAKLAERAETPEMGQRMKFSKIARLAVERAREQGREADFDSTLKMVYSKAGRRLPSTAMAPESAHRNEGEWGRHSMQTRTKYSKRARAKCEALQQQGKPADFAAELRRAYAADDELPISFNVKF